MQTYQYLEAQSPHLSWGDDPDLRLARCICTVFHLLMECLWDQELEQCSELDAFAVSTISSANKMWKRIANTKSCDMWILNLSVCSWVWVHNSMRMIDRHWWQYEMMKESAFSSLMLSIWMQPGGIIWWTCYVIGYGPGNIYLLTVVWVSTSKGHCEQMLSASKKMHFRWPDEICEATILPNTQHQQWAVTYFTTYLGHVV